MGRKRKRVRASPTAAGDLVEVESRPAATPLPAAAAPAAAAAAAEAAAESSTPTLTSPTLQQQPLVPVNTTFKGSVAVADDTSPEDDEDSPGILGIPWALPPHESNDDDDDDEEEDQGDQEDQEEEGHSGSSDEGDEGRSSSPSVTMSPDPHNRWKQHPDRRKKLAAGGRGGGGRSSNNSNSDRGRRQAEVGGRVDKRTLAGSRRRAGGGGGRGGVANGGVARDEPGDDDSPGGMGGHYGPGAHAPPPCTSFAPRKGKVQRVGGRTSTAADALVVGLDPREQLCFVGAALVRCGRGQADLSGYTLLPAAWGPYVAAHSPRWMSLLVVRALDAEEYLDGGARDSSGGDGSSAAGDGGDAEDKVENEIEEAIDRIAEDFPVVVVFKPLLGGGRLAFMSAQADADALYFPEPVDKATAAGRHQELQSPGRMVCGDTEQEGDDKATSGGATPAAAGSTRDSLDSSCGEEAAVCPALRLAAELRLPGMQIVVSDYSGLRPFTVSRDWADAIDAVLATPPPSNGGGSGPVLVCGAKGVGKSSLCRFLVNRILGRHREVAYMDCDLGQPEFTPPGQVSLHLLQTPVVGPPHANIRRPELAYFIGTTTSKPEPLLYSAAVRALAEHAGASVTAAAGQHHQEQQQRSASFFAGDPPPPPPLVVNTDGWVKGMGEDLLGAVIDAVRPRHIVQILGTSTAKTFELDLDRLPQGCEVHRVKAWSPPPPVVGGALAPPRPSPQDQRTLRLVAYFLGQGQGGRGGDSGSGAGDSFSGDRSTRGVADSTAAVEGGEKEMSAGRRRCTSNAAAGASGLPEGSVVGAAKGGDSGSNGGRLRSASMRGGKVYDQEHEVAALLAALRPRRVPWRAVQIRVMNGSVSPGLVLHAINGALVGLVAMPGRQSWEVGTGGIGVDVGDSGGGGGGGGVAGSNVGSPVGEALVCLAETPLAPCAGLGIVRSVDVENRVLFVLTPEPLEVLKGVNVLVMGSLQLPMVMLHDPNWCSHPYFSSEVVGGGVIKNRNNLLRRGV